MDKIAKVFINMPIKTISKAYSYIIPEKFNFLDIGWRVCVSFGHQLVEGFILEIEVHNETKGLKEITAVVDSVAWFDKAMLDTAKWLSSYYLCSLGESMRLFIPGKRSVAVDTLYEASDIYESKKRDDEYWHIYQYLKENGQCQLTSLKRKFPQCHMEVILNKLLQQNSVKKTYSFRSRFKRKVEKFIVLNQSLCEERAEYFRNKPAQQRLINLIREKKKISRNELRQFSSAVIHALIKEKFIEIVEEKVLRDSYKSFNPLSNNETRLNEVQQTAVQHINNKIVLNKYAGFLLYGVTGSGKTEVYINVVMQARKLNKQAIILVPEIALANQMIYRFNAVFGDDIVVMHSKLSVDERNDAIERLRSKEVGIVIGARSAVFVPMDNLGIIIIDEEHEFAYKQEERPYYHTRTVAKIRADFSGSILLLGSATPSIDTFYKAQQGEYELLSLPSRINGNLLPKIKVVDMRVELAKGRKSILSTDLCDLINNTLMNNEQIIILLNRRGHSTFVLCRECGHVVKCDHCDSPMVYHNNGILRCHYCDSTTVVPHECPKCYSRYIKYFGTGTQRLEEELNKQFPQATILRMDKDTTQGKMAYDAILNDFRKEKYNILLGTQMVAKGHDFKNVTAVAILSIDSTLNIPDFRSAERGFDLLTQAAGRAGRHGKTGHVIIQTYNPEHYALQHAHKHDFIGFYHEEIALRKILDYPPYSSLMKFTICDSDKNLLMKKAEIFSVELENILQTVNCKILGPFKAGVEKVKDLYRINLLIKSTQMKKVKSIILQNDMDKRQNIMIDVDPLNSM